MVGWLTLDYAPRSYLEMFGFLFWAFSQSSLGHSPAHSLASWKRCGCPFPASLAWLAPDCHSCHLPALGSWDVMKSGDHRAWCVTTKDDDGSKQGTTMVAKAQAGHGVKVARSSRRWICPSSMEITMRISPKLPPDTTPPAAFGSAACTIPQPRCLLRRRPCRTRAPPPDRTPCTTRVRQ